MKANRFAIIAALFATLAFASGAAARVAGGKNVAASCLATFEGVEPGPSGPNNVECEDGSACDQDGTANNSCSIPVTVCAFQTDVDGCTPSAVTKFAGSAVKKGLLNLPPVPVSAPTCGDLSVIVVPIKAKKTTGKVKVVLKAVGTTNPKNDANKLKFICNKAEPSCANNPAGGPRQLTYTILDHGTDLDTGFSGVSHNFPVITGARVRLCLSDCDGTGDTECTANGPTGAGTFNGTTFGPPLPLFAAGVPVCVRNDFVEPALQGTANVATGQFDSTVAGAETPIRLSSVVFSTSANKVCPECLGGRCDSGTREGQSCQVNGTVRVRNPSQGIDKGYNLSSQCPPGDTQGSLTGSIPINLGVTTGTSTIMNGSKPCPGQQKDDQCATFSTTCSVNCDATPDVKGGFNQWCCGDALSTPCFPTAGNSGEPNHAIVRTGTPVPPTPAYPDQTYPKTANEAKQVATFCIASAGSATIDQVAGLPGPGAVTFNGTVVLEGNLTP